MNRMTWTIAMILGWVLPAVAGDATHLKDEIWGLKWGSSVSTLVGAQQTGSKGPVDYYIKPGTVYVIDQFEFRRVIYGFHQDRLFAVYAHIDNIEMFSRVRSYIQSKYGIPKMVISTKSELPEVYRWKDKPIKIKMKSKPQSGEMKLAFYYMPVSNQVNEAEQEAYEEKSIRFLPIEKDSQYERIPLLTF